MSAIDRDMVTSAGHVPFNDLPIAKHLSVAETKALHRPVVYLRITASYTHLLVTCYSCCRWCCLRVASLSRSSHTTTQLSHSLSSQTLRFQGEMRWRGFRTAFALNATGSIQFTVLSQADGQAAPVFSRARKARPDFF
jgi:hypothetical protein